MTQPVKGLLLVLAILLAAIIITGCSSRFVPVREGGTDTATSSYQPTNGTVQSNAEGSVTIDVAWAETGSSSIIFNVVMDTHSVDLDSYDLGQLAVLRDDTGKQYRAINWDSAPGGHHRQGILTFPLPDSVKQGKARHVEVIIRDVAGIAERVLTWEL